MTTLAALISLSIGSVTGIVYGLSFLHGRSNRALSFVFTFVRLACLAIFFFYLLRLPAIHFIILLPSFLIMFWLTVLNRKATLNERF